MTEVTGGPVGDPLDSDELDDDYDDEPEAMREAFDAPQVTSIVAFVLAVLSFGGFGLMNGAAYIPGQITNADQNGRMVVTLMFGAALTLLPIALGWHAASRTLDDDPPWIATLARCAMLIGLGSLVLRLVAAFVQAGQNSPTPFVHL